MTKQSIFDQLEAVRKTTLHHIKKWSWIFGVLAMIAMIALLLNFGPIGMLGSVPFVLVFLLTIQRQMNLYMTEVSDVKSKVVQQIMATHHPNVIYKYADTNAMGNYLIKNSKLISYSSCEEEDVLRGIINGSEFYISQVELIKGHGKHQETVFEGMLLQIKLSDLTFPDMMIRKEQMDFFEKLFKTEEYDPHNNWYFQSQNKEEVYHKLTHIMPFLRYLSSRRKQFAMRIEGSVLTMMLEDSEDFLDTPSISIFKETPERLFVDTATRQLNSLMYIVEKITAPPDSNNKDLDLQLKELIELESKLDGGIVKGNNTA